MDRKGLQTNEDTDKYKGISIFGKTHAWTRKHLLIVAKAIHRSGMVFFRASALRALIQRGPRSWGPKPHFSLRLDSSTDSNSDVRTALPEIDPAEIKYGRFDN